MAQIYKIWSANRMKKVCIVADKESSQLYNEIVLKASTKLEINGSKLVFESDGTEVDDETLRIINAPDTPLLLLSKEESWYSECSASTSTVSAPSSPLPAVNLDLIDYINNSASLEEHLDQNKQNSPSLNINDINEFFWHNYSIPFNKLDDDILKELDNGTKNKTVKNGVIHFIVKEIRKIKPLIPSKCLQIIARKCVDKFPTTFKDVDEEGTVLGNGSHSTFHKLLDHNNYLNRPHKRHFTNPNEQSRDLKQRKTMSSARAGCLNWQPSEDPDSSDALIETKKKNLQIYATRIGSLTTEEKIKVLEDLEATYTAQRKFLNEKPPTIKELLKEWPILLVQTYLYWHYNKLMGHSIKILTENFKVKIEKFIRFGLKKKIISSTDNEAFKDCNEDDKAIKTLSIIVQYFKENLNNLFILKEEWTTLDTVKVETLSPCIAKFGTRYYTFIEGININAGTDSIFEALEEVFASYYVCNMAYPRQICCTLEFIQRYCLKIHPDGGSKSQKQNHTKFKVLTLINNLIDI